MDLLGKLSQLDYVLTSKINKIFEKLEEIRTYQSQKAGAFTTNPTAFTTEIAKKNNYVDNNYPTEIKNYIEILETSKYIPEEYSSRIVIPNAITDYIKASEYYNDYVDIVNELTQICADDSSYYSSNYRSDHKSDDRSDHYSNNSDRGGDCSFLSAHDQGNFDGLGANGVYDF